MKNTSLLRIEKLHAGYNSLKILKGVDIDLAPGQIVALIGPNGAGKSTVIKAVFSIANISSGKISFNGKDITGMKTYGLIREGISYVSQGRINFANLTVEENLAIGADMMHEKDYVKRRIKEIYRRFPVLEEKSKDLAYTLSGGQQQMLAIGRSLMHEPKLLMLDEPSLGLSPALQKELFAIIKQLKHDGISILIVEQNAKRAIEMADQTYLLEDGKIVLKGGKSIVRHKKIKSVYLGGRY